MKIRAKVIFRALRTRTRRQLIKIALAKAVLRFSLRTQLCQINRVKLISLKFILRRNLV